MELPGIETDALPGLLPCERRFHYVSFLLSPTRYLRFRSRLLTASRAVTHSTKLLSHFMGDCGRPFVAQQTAISGPAVHQTRLQGGDASSDSYCYTS
jgi:hypothetical protein